MQRTICRWVCAAILAAASGGAAAPAWATTTTALGKSPRLWATIDVCSVSSSSDIVGVRGSMPGSGGAATEMYMRFRLQYRDAEGTWHYVGKTGDSGFVDVGSGDYVSRQGGSDFVLPASTAAGTVLRGTVIFDWRRGGHVEHHLERATSGGHSVTAGSSPVGFSASLCTLG